MNFKTLSVTWCVSEQQGSWHFAQFSLPSLSFMWGGDYAFVAVCTLYLKGDTWVGEGMWLLYALFWQPFKPHVSDVSVCSLSPKAFSFGIWKLIYQINAPSIAMVCVYV